MGQIMTRYGVNNDQIVIIHFLPQFFFLPTYDFLPQSWSFFTPNDFIHNIIYGNI